MTPDGTVPDTTALSPQQDQQRVGCSCCTRRPHPRPRGDPAKVTGSLQQLKQVLADINALRTRSPVKAAKFDAISKGLREVALGAPAGPAEVGRLVVHTDRNCKRSHRVRKDGDRISDGPRPQVGEGTDIGLNEHRTLR